MLTYSLSSPASVSIVAAVTHGTRREERRWGGPAAELDRQRDQRGRGDELDRRQGVTVGLS
jgi:hypothetical protein